MNSIQCLFEQVLSLTVSNLHCSKKRSPSKREHRLNVSERSIPIIDHSSHSDLEDRESDVQSYPGVYEFKASLDPVQKTNTNKQTNTNTLKLKHVGHSNLYNTSAQDLLRDELRTAPSELTGCVKNCGTVWSPH